jgi:hypothetical protein
VKKNMRALEFSRIGLGIGVTALLCACGGSSIPSASDRTSGDAGTTKSQTFHYTGKEQTFIVPAGVSQLTVVAHGGEGGGFAYYPSTNTPGFSGRVYAIIPVHPYDKLYVFVGGSGLHGGFNGGGTGGTSEGGRYTSGNPGGGASDVRMGGHALKDRIVVAGGGGGAGVAIYTYGSDYGGNGGGLVAQSGGGSGSAQTGGGGAGGTQSAGGSGGLGGYSYQGSQHGQPGSDGALGQGGNGGNGSSYGYAGGGGGGGGGYYGGGGGGGGGVIYYDSRFESSQGGGGGGGSSFVEPNAIKYRMWQGWKKAKGDGLVVFSWSG